MAQALACVVLYVNRYINNFFNLNSNKIMKKVFFFLGILLFLTKSYSYAQNKDCPSQKPCLPCSATQEKDLPSAQFDAFSNFSQTLSLEKSKHEIENIVIFLKDFPIARVLIGAHTSNEINEVEAKKRTDKMCKILKDELIRLGIKCDRIETESFGFTQPVVSNDSPISQSLNKRLSIKVLCCASSISESAKQNPCAPCSAKQEKEVPIEAQFGSFRNFSADPDLKIEKSKDDLESVIYFLKDYPNANIIIQAHTSNELKEQAAQQRTEKMAKLIKDEIVRAGIKVTRVQTESFGSTQPQVLNDSPQNRALNKRIIIKVICCANN